MIFYHGSDVIVKNPDILHSYHHLDFGVGFYVTSVKEQAERWAKRKAILNGKKKGFVSSYEYDENSSFKIKDFADDLDSWIDFVCECRGGSEIYKNYDVIKGKVTFPENYHADLAGKDATFKCVVHEVKTKEVPTLNDEFVKELELEGVNTVEEYQEYVKNLLKDNKTKAAEQQFEHDCVEAVLKNSYAEFPQSLINQAVERNVARLEQQAKQYQVPVEILLQYYQMGTLEDFKKMSEEQVRKEFLQELVFEEIIKLEGFVATAEELEAKYLELAGGDQAKVKQVKKQYREAQVAFHINSLKVVELIKANAVTK